MNYLVNTYNSVSKPQVKTTTNITDWLNQIKNSSYSHTITQARLNELDYDSTKLSLPCVTYNFLFDKYKKDQNIIQGTGLLYIDIDNPLFDISILDKNKVFAYYHSFGGNGYAILVRVEGVNFNNFKTTYAEVCSDLGISEFIDVQAVKPSQFSILSYDEDLYVNDRPYVYSASTSYSFENITAPPSVVIEYKEKAYTTDGGAAIRFNNIDEIEFEGDYTVNWNGYEIIKAFMPIRQIKDGRKKTLLSYTTNLVYLNPDITREKVFKILQAVNNKICQTPLNDADLIKSINTVFKYKAEGTLKPIFFNKKRKIVFAQKSKLTYDEKMVIVRTELAKRNKDLSLQKLYSIIEDWDFLNSGAISQRNVYENNKISKKTVEKYWPEVKDYVNTLNDHNRYKIQVGKNLN